jgi:hypothetical protein
MSVFLDLFLGDSRFGNLGWGREQVWVRRMPGRVWMVRAKYRIPPLRQTQGQNDALRKSAGCKQRQG